MEVRLFPHSTRPGVGLKPREDSMRPLLPQHSRHCPVLEAGSGLGLLVYPPLEENEAFEAEFQGDGRYLFTFYMGSRGVAVAADLPDHLVAAPGRRRQDQRRRGVPGAGCAASRPTRRAAWRGVSSSLKILARQLAPSRCVAPPTFSTPDGWDTVYTSVLNNIERPIAPVLVVRVETDWYAHETEFRYVLQPGEAISGARNMPVGQVFFVPRETVTMRDCTAEELAAIRESKREFARQKSAVTLPTPHGLQYSPYYARQSKARKP